MKLVNFVPILFLLACMSQKTWTANILAMLPFPAYSHINNFMPIFKGLAARGHNVTLVSPFPQVTPVPNLTDVVVPNIMDQLMGSFAKQKVQDMDSLFFQLIGLWMFGTGGLKEVMKLEPVQRFIKDTNSKFDLVIVEAFFIQEVMVAFGHKYNAPVINIMPAFFFPSAAYLTGNHIPPSYVPALKLPHSDRMSFLQRAWNTFHYVWDVVGSHCYYFRKLDALMRENFKYPGSENLPYITDLLRNTSLTMMDYNSAVGYPAPRQSNVIEFGGINIKDATKLTPDLQKYMDEATDGVVYFSFGSHAKVSYLLDSSQLALMSVLGKLKQKVIMKVEDTNPFKEKANSNILLKSWLPQASILAHPNCRLFITHGGLHGLMESIYHAVPMVGIPLFADQKHNMKFAESVGIAYYLRHEDLNEENLLQAINTVLNDPSYYENIKKRSAIFKDTPMNILDNAMYWVEYVIRHKGAPHLRPAVLDLYWYQYLLLDVVALYAVILGLVMFVIVIIFKLMLCCVRYLFHSKKSSKKVKKQ